MRLIDADALLKNVEDKYPIDNYEFQEMIKDAPTINRENEICKPDIGRWPINYSMGVVLQDAIDTYGKEAQTWMVIEEMSELAKEICKNKRGRENREQIADEVADVTIMLEQVKMMFGISDTVERRIILKVERLKRRLLLKAGL